MCFSLILVILFWSEQLDNPLRNPLNYRCRVYSQDTLCFTTFPSFWFRYRHFQTGQIHLREMRAYSLEGGGSHMLMCSTYKVMLQLRTFKQKSSLSELYNVIV